MSSPELEGFLAHLYTDAFAREQFLQDPMSAALQAGLGEPDVRALEAIDRIGLRMAAHSYAHKRAGHAHAGDARSWWARCRTWIGQLWRS